MNEKENSKMILNRIKTLADVGLDAKDTKQLALIQEELERNCRTLKSNVNKRLVTENSARVKIAHGDY